MLTSLTRAQLACCETELTARLERCASSWNSHGWAIVGTKDAFRIEIAVAKTLAHPAHPIEPIALSTLGVTLKPSVRSSRDGLAARAVVFDDSGHASPTLESSVREPLAPGSRFVATSTPNQRAGIACVVDADGEPYLVTCGHIFEPGASSTGIYTLGHKIATLSRNFLEDDPQLDAAYCQLTAKGKQLLEVSSTAPTWFDEVLAPEDGQGQEAVFWPTNEGAGDALTTTINSYSASEGRLFNEFWDLSLSHLIRTEPITFPGDSGSLLSIGNRYYGSCTGTPSWSYFTPLQDTLARIREHFTKVELWRPV